MIIQNILKLHNTLHHADIPVISIHENGDIEFSQTLTPQQSLLVAQLIAAHTPEEPPPNPTIEERITATEDAVTALLTLILAT